MKINNLSIISRHALDFEFAPTAPISILRGEHSALALDLIREVIGDMGENDPDGTDDGSFVIHTDLEMDGKDYAVCYIRNADFIGDNRIAVNFDENSIDFSRQDTKEYLEKCRLRNSAESRPAPSYEEDDRPLFVYLGKSGESGCVIPSIETLSNMKRQVFVAAPDSFPEIRLGGVQNLFVG